MGLSLKFHCCLIVSFSFMVLLPAVLCYRPHDYFVKSRATYYGTPDRLGTPSGACGFGEYGRTVNGANVAAVSRSLYNNGTGCGACYKVRCTNPQLCSYDGVNVVVTDYGEGDRTDFILSPRAYERMAKRPRTAKQLFAYGVVDVEYQRIPCTYEGYKLKLKVNEHSSYPYYLAIVTLYQPGQNEIQSIDIWREDSKKWVPMRRSYGAVFDIANPPLGPVTLRFQVRTKRVRVQNIIPSYWKPGAVYESNVKLA